MELRLSAVLLSLALSAHAADAIPEDASISTLITTPLAIEGLTSDNWGNLYIPGRTPGLGLPCPTWRTSIEAPGLTIVGLIPAPSATAQCSPSGVAFGPDGMLYVSEGDRILRFMPDGAIPPFAEVFASGLPGTNGLAFDRGGNVWTGDGTTGQGRIWRIDPQGTATEMFRIQAMANLINVSAGMGGVGRDVRTLPPGTITVTATSRNAADTLGSQALVANGLAFDRNGNLFIADTARGAIWRVRIHPHGRVAAAMGCDTTFPPNTLCLENILVSHPLLEGIDGIALDVSGNIWAVANERNAIVVTTTDGQVVEVFRNPPDPVTQLRNVGPLEFPTSPVIAGHRFCTSNSDGNRRDNSPSAAGEIGGVGQPRGKIACLDQKLGIRGMPLPVR
jgi:sugar lactone lactonase YvrE